MRSTPLLSVFMLAIAVLAGCEARGVPAVPVPAQPAQPQHIGPAHVGIVQFEIPGEAEPLRKTLEIGPGKSTTDYQRVEFSDSTPGFEFRFLKHENGADHYRFGAFPPPTRFEGAGPGQDVAYSGSEVVVFDYPEYKVVILPKASDATSADAR